MNTIELARDYLNLMYLTEEFDALYEILDVDFQFFSPKFCFTSAEKFVETMKSLAEEQTGYSYKIMEEYEKQNSACLIYRLTREYNQTVVAQVFHADNNLIQSVRQIYDVRSIENSDL